MAFTHNYPTSVWSSVDFGCEDYDSDSMVISKDLSINNKDGTNDFLGPEDSFVCKENGEEDPKDAMIDKPQTSLSISITTPSPCPQILSDKLLTKIKLLSILRRHKISLCVHKKNFMIGHTKRKYFVALTGVMVAIHTGGGQRLSS